MKPLDLQKDTPIDFEGKYVTLGPRRYIIGSLLRENDQGYAHALINEVSGLCLHIMQIRKEYQSDPEQALGASEVKREATAELRSKLRVNEPDMYKSISPITVYQEHGGSFEIHEERWGGFGGTDNLPGERDITAAQALINEQKYQEAIETLLILLKEHPQHTVALQMLSQCYSQLGDEDSSIDAMYEILEIEPNCIAYKGIMISQGINISNQFFAMSEFEEFKSKYPHIDDYDSYGIEAYTYCGMPEKALHLFQSAKHHSEKDIELEQNLKQWVQTKRDYLELERNYQQRLKDKSLTLDGLVGELKSLHERYPLEPYIQVNLGFKLRAADQYHEAGEYIFRAFSCLPDYWRACCFANIAFCSTQLKDWDTALTSYSATINILDSYPQEINMIDVPGVTTWISTEWSSVEVTSPSGYELLNTAIKNCSDKRLVTPAIERLAELYHQAAEAYRDTKP